MELTGSLARRRRREEQLAGVGRRGDSWVEGSSARLGGGGDWRGGKPDSGAEGTSTAAPDSAAEGRRDGGAVLWRRPVRKKPMRMNTEGQGSELWERVR